MNQPAPTPDTEHPLGFGALASDLPPDILEPVLAGLRARRVAEACEAAGVAAILVDATGRVLHVASRAKTLLGQGIDIVADHLVGQTRASRDALRTALTEALADGRKEPASLERGVPSCGVVGLPYEDRSPYQLLRGIVILGREEPTATLSALFAG